MRKADVLKGFDEIKTLFQYLYMDEDHYITVSNGICDLQIHMSENLLLRCKNMNFTDLPDSGRDIDLLELLNIIAQLKESKPVEFPERFKNRWEEIKSIASTKNNEICEFWDVCTRTLI